MLDHSVRSMLEHGVRTMLEQCQSSVRAMLELCQSNVRAQCQINVRARCQNNVRAMLEQCQSNVRAVCSKMQQVTPICSANSDIFSCILIFIVLSLLLYSSNKFSCEELRRFKATIVRQNYWHIFSLKISLIIIKQKQEISGMNTKLCRKI